MTDEGRTTVAALAGEPAGWRATLRDLLRHLRAGSTDREAAREWLREAGAADADAATAHLEFLEVAGIVEVDAGGGTVRPGPSGREFLDTHDEGVLYEALADADAGFGPLLESLAVRPLTDVEFRDLLERAFDADVPSRAVRARRQWLQALGYIEHDDGVNDLTRAGRRRVETDADLTPPRANHPGGRAGEAPSAEIAGDAEPPVEIAGDTEPPSGPIRGVGGEGPDAGDGPNSDRTSDPVGAPDDADDLESLKRRYDHTCMVCGDRRQRSPEAGYALVHHPMPAGEDHGGPADPANAVVVCPNHRADFRRGLLRVDPVTHEIDHAYEERVAGRTLETVDGHDLGAQYLAYHDEVVAEF